MYTLRKSLDRGHAKHGWLESYHSFSFADYYDPMNMGFGVLRVINEDWIQGEAGFPTHPHRDMEIVTYVIEGALNHKDTLGNVTTIKPGEIQRMSAGTGIRHSEFNAFSDRQTHLLQIWILPEKEGLSPSYGQKNFEFLPSEGLRLVASKSGRDGSVSMNQDVDIYSGHLEARQVVEFQMRLGRKVWIQMVRGELILNDQTLSGGDGLGITDEELLKISAMSQVEFLLFDLP